MIITGGLGALFGSAASIPPRWSDRGVTLMSVNRQSLVMGSLISFQVVAESESSGYEAIRRAEKIFRSLEKTFSMYDEESEMAKLAANAGKQPVAVSREAMELLRFAKQVHQQSGGRFDITIEPAMRRWGFRNNPGKSISQPSDGELKKLERLIGSEKIQLADEKVLLTEPGMAIDTGGIAGGYALDKAIEEMKKCEIAAAFINFSGDIHCFGQPLKGKNWPVHILDPKTGQPLQKAIELDDEALSTSGAYQNRRHNNDQQSWGHLLLPDRAKPVEPVGSLTAMHPTAMAADAWSTAAYVGSQPPSDVRTVILSGN